MSLPPWVFAALELVAAGPDPQVCAPGPVETSTSGWSCSAEGARGWVIRPVRDRSALIALELHARPVTKTMFAIALRDGREWRIGQLDFGYGAELAAHRALDMTALVGQRAWGLVFARGEAGNGNNAGGFTEYLLAIFTRGASRQLELGATMPIGRDSFSRMVTDEGFHLHQSHTVLCPSIRGGKLILSRSCGGFGDPRSRLFDGLGGPETLGELCRRTQRDQCRQGAESIPAVEARAGAYFVRNGAFLPIVARDRVRGLGADSKLQISERPLPERADRSIDWLELENTTDRFTDLAGLGLAGEHGDAAIVEGPCVIAPHDVVVLRRGRGPAWDARVPECFYDDVGLRGTIEVIGPAGRMTRSWPASTYGSSLQIDSGGRSCFQSESPGVKNRACR